MVYMAHYASVITIIFSIGQAFVSTMISVMLALPLAYFFALYSFRSKAAWLSLCMVLTIMPTKFVALCVTSFGMCGFWGIIFGHVLLNVPFALISLYLVLRKYDATLYMAAAQAGASRLHYYKDIMWPVVRPAVLSTIILIFIICFASFSIPLLVGTGAHHYTLDLIIQNAYGVGDYGTVVGYSILRLLVFIPVVWLLGQTQHNINHQIIALVPRENNYAPSVHGWGFFVYGALVALSILMPVLFFIYRIVDAAMFNFWYTAAQGNVDHILGVSVIHVLYNSLTLGSISALCVVLVALLICYGEQHIVLQRNRFVYIVLTNLPFILGGVLTGILFSAGAGWTGMPRFVLAVICHIFLNYPFTYCIIRAQHALLLPEWRLSAQSLGASSWQMLKTIDFPFLRSALRNAWMIAFGLSLTEVGAGSILGDAAGITLPMAIRIYRAHGLDTQAIGLSFVLLVIVLVVGISQTSSK